MAVEIDLCPFRSLKPLCRVSDCSHFFFEPPLGALEGREAFSTFPELFLITFDGLRLVEIVDFGTGGFFLSLMCSHQFYEHYPRDNLHDTKYKSQFYIRPS